MKSLTELLTDYAGETAEQSPKSTKSPFCDLKDSALPSVSDSGKPGFKEFMPLGNTEPLTPFPIALLCKVLPDTCDFIFAAAESIQTSFDLVGSCTLGAIEIACRGRYPVRIPSGHTERPCLYICPIAPPSERKSGVIETTIRPLIAFEAEYNREHGGEVAHNKSEERLLQGRIAALEANIIKSKIADERLRMEQELEGLNKKLAEFNTLEPLRLFGADVTPEKLAGMLKSQGGVFALVSAEGGGIFENIGRYCDKGGLEIYLNGYSGDRVTIDRKTSGSIVIDNPALSVLAPVQPSVINTLFADTEKAGRGLLSRILFVKCYTRVGQRQAVNPPIAQAVSGKYHKICEHILRDTATGTLEFDDKALAVYTAFFGRIEPSLTPGSGDLDFMADWAGKLHGQMIRLSGLVHVTACTEKGQNPLDSPINEEEARAGAELAMFFLDHAKAVYLEQAETSEIRNARYLWGRIKTLDNIAKGDLVRKVQSKNGFSLDESLCELEKRGYLRMNKISTGGRPAVVIFINPAAKGV